MASVMDYQTGRELDGVASEELLEASRGEASGTGAVAAYLDDDGTWQHVSDSEVSRHERLGHAVTTVYVQD